MSDAQRRALRSLFQVGVVQGLMLLYNAFAAVPLTANQTTAITVAITPLFVFAQNWLEDNTRMAAVGKAPASPGQNPTGDPPRLLEHPDK